MVDTSIRHGTWSVAEWRGWLNTHDGGVYTALSPKLRLHLFPVLVDPYHRRLEGSQCFKEHSLHLTDTERTPPYVVQAVQRILHKRRDMPSDLSRRTQTDGRMLTIAWIFFTIFSLTHSLYSRATLGSVDTVGKGITYTPDGKR